MTGGARLTTTMATSLATTPAGFVAVKTYEPESATRTLLSVRVGPVAPAIGTPFLLHWKLSGALPEAAAVKTMLSPSIVVLPTGCVVIVGGVNARVTDRFLNVIEVAKLEPWTRQPKKSKVVSGVRLVSVVEKL